MTIKSGINAIDSLAYSSWSPGTGTPVALTYSFLTKVPAGASSDDANGFVAMTAVQRAAVKVALDTWAAVANITFTLVTAGGDIELGTNNQGGESSAYAYLPDGRDPVQLYLNNAGNYNSTFSDGGFSRSVLIHELGHTLGLKHPGNYNSTGGSVDGPFLPAATDNLDYTQMSYNEGAGYDMNGLYGITPMLYDIQAIQYLYGANMSYHTGADTYSFTKYSALQCIWDAGGSDTFDFSACTGATIINLNAGTFSETAPGYKNISIAYGVTIERAVASSGGSTIYGNDAGNVIVGGKGSDTITLGAGNDVVTGGGGNDKVIFAGALSAHTFTGSLTAMTVSGEGVDVLNNISVLQFSDRSLSLSSYVGLHGGTDGADVMVAGSGNELFSGGAGIDTVRYSGGRANYVVSASGAEFTVTDGVGAGGVDLLSGIERLQFADGAGVAFDVDGAAGQAYRMYQSAFDRTPDVAGLGHWITLIDNGMSLDELSFNFLNSDEYKTTYGATDDLQFVTQMYANVLHRTPDSAGLAHFLKGLDDGSFSRELVLHVFSESAENQTAVVAAISNGMEYTLS